MWRNLAASSTSGEFYRKVASLQIDQEDTETLDRARWYTGLTAGIAGSVSNPFYLLGGEAIVGQTILKGTLKGAIEGAVTGLVSELATEGVLLGNQEQRELSESLSNIAISGIAGSLFGGIGGTVKALKYPIYKRMIEEELEGGVAHFAMNNKNQIAAFNVYDANGAFKKKIDLHGDQLLGLNSKGEYSAASPFLWFAGSVTKNPIIQVLKGKSGNAARFMSGWLENNMDVVSNVKHGENVPISVQRKIQSWKDQTHIGNKLVIDGYMEYLGNQPGMNVKNIIARNFNPPPGMMKIEEFSKQLYYPIVTGRPHENSIVQKISMQIQKAMFEPVTNGLVEVGKLAKDTELSTAAGHVTRLYDVPHMEAYPVKTKQFFVDSFKETRANVMNATIAQRNLESEVFKLKESLINTVNDKTKDLLKKQLASKQRALLKEKRESVIRTAA